MSRDQKDYPSFSLEGVGAWIAQHLADAEAAGLANRPGYGRLSNYGFANNVARVSPTPQQVMNALKQQDTAFDAERRRVALQNSWMLAPVLGPPLLAGFLGLGSAAAEARAVQPEINLTSREPGMRGGQTPATMRGQRAHAAFKARLDQKPGWDGETTISADDGRKLRPDGLGPVRSAAPKPVDRFGFNLKPDTPSGHRAALKDGQKYLDGLGLKTRGIFYNPEDYNQ